MTDELEMNDFILQTECEGLAQDIFDNMLHDDLHDGGTPELYADVMNERAHETVDHHQWVTYYFWAHRVCMHCTTDWGEGFLEDTGMPENVSYDSLATTITFGEMLARVEIKLRELVEEWEPAKEVES